jgi:hypothetical protein
MPQSQNILVREDTARLPNEDPENATGTGVTIRVMMMMSFICSCRNKKEEPSSISEVSHAPLDVRND